MKAIINISSDALGDTIAWIPYAEEYRKATGFDVIVRCAHETLFKKTYPNLTFDKDVIPKQSMLYFNIGYGLDERHKSIPMQQIATMTLNIPYKEIRPRLEVPKKKKRKKPYVCIATQSTAQAKYWNNPKGWQTVVDYLISKGYDVLDIDKEKSYGTKGYSNTIPKGVVDKTGKIPLKNRVKDLAGAEFFIGLGSGLSWLAWAVKTPVIMISGFSAPYTEFTDCKRITGPEDKCKDCLNNFKFDPSDWVWCPSDDKREMFECTKYIQPSEVIEAIEELRNDN